MPSALILIVIALAAAIVLGITTESGSLDPAAGFILIAFIAIFAMGAGINIMEEGQKRERDKALELNLAHKCYTSRDKIIVEFGVPTTTSIEKCTGDRQ